MPAPATITGLVLGLHAPVEAEVLAEPDCHPWVAGCDHEPGGCPVTTCRACRECTRLAALAAAEPGQAPVVEHPCPTVTAVLADPVGEAIRALTP
jgi:hypothetical protein